MHLGGMITEDSHVEVQVWRGYKRVRMQGDGQVKELKGEVLSSCVLLVYLP